MLERNYFRSEYDSYVYFMNLLDDSFIYFLLYVDDMLIAFKNMSEINSLKNQLSSEFEIKCLGITKKILGMEIHKYQSASKLYLLQKKYFKKVLEHFGMQNYKPVSVSLAPRFRLCLTFSLENKDEKKYISYVSYASVVISNIYVIICTRQTFYMLLVWLIYL